LINIELCTKLLVINRVVLFTFIGRTLKKRSLI